MTSNKKCLLLPDAGDNAFFPGQHGAHATQTGEIKFSATKWQHRSISTSMGSTILLLFATLLTGQRSRRPETDVDK